MEYCLFNRFRPAQKRMTKRLGTVGLAPTRPAESFRSVRAAPVKAGRGDNAHREWWRFPCGIEPPDARDLAIAGQKEAQIRQMQQCCWKDFSTPHRKNRHRIPRQHHHDESGAMCRGQNGLRLNGCDHWLQRLHDCDPGCGRAALHPASTAATGRATSSTGAVFFRVSGEKSTFRNHTAYDAGLQLKALPSRLRHA